VEEWKVNDWWLVIIKETRKYEVNSQLPAFFVGGGAGG
jgi:hypothetical protein